ncbi:hypothetical protein [uncultured Leifsonia sp.]|uniref:hypothetical protein n=1 Tax=uncultured Leifsonia sp. TaxID=340359 RepID=UPI0028D2896B|nr:hypothetical protein [uncultured Leifsonia sp.]
MAARKLRITFHDGKTVEVQPTLEDRLKFETTLKRNRGWGDLKDNALKLEPFMAWSAASRAGETSLTWEEFTTGETAALDVEAVKDDDGDDQAEAELEVEGVGKGTRKGRSTSSRSS